MNLNRTKEECDWFIRVKNLDSYQLENELFGRMMMIRISFLPLPSHVVHVLFGGNKLEDRVERHLRERRQIIRQTLCIPRSTINDSRSGHITRIPIPRCEHASFVPYKRQKPPTKSFHTRFISLPSWLLPSPLLSPFKFQIFDTWLKKERERDFRGGFSSLELFARMDRISKRRCRGKRSNSRDDGGEERNMCHGYWVVSWRGDKTTTKTNEKLSFHSKKKKEERRRRRIERSKKKSK